LELLMNMPMQMENFDEGRLGKERRRDKSDFEDKTHE